MRWAASRLAHSIGAIRRATEASGSRIRVSELELLLHIAGGTDTLADLAEATGLSQSRCTRALQFLEGLSAPVEIAGDRVMRVSPLRLIERRRHPHQRGYQFRLTREGRILLQPLELPPSQEWSQ